MGSELGEAELLEALADGRIDAVARGEIGNLDVVQSSEGAFAVTALDDGGRPAAFRWRRRTPSCLPAWTRESAGSPTTGTSGKGIGWTTLRCSWNEPGSGTKERGVDSGFRLASPDSRLFGWADDYSPREEHSGRPTLSPHNDHTLPPDCSVGRVPTYKSKDPGIAAWARAKLHTSQWLESALWSVGQSRTSREKLWIFSSLVELPKQFVSASFP